VIQLLAIRHAPVTVERVFYGQTDVAAGLTWEETLEGRLDFLQAKRFSRAPSSLAHPSFNEGTRPE